MKSPPKAERRGKKPRKLGKTKAERRGKKPRKLGKTKAGKQVLGKGSPRWAAEPKPKVGKNGDIRGVEAAGVGDGGGRVDVKVLAAIIVFSLLIRLSFFVFLHPWTWTEEDFLKNFSFPDERSYYRMGKRLSHDLGSIWEKFDHARVPGYPLFMAALYRVFGVKIWPVFIAQMMANAGILALVYLIGRQIFKSRWVPLIASFIYSLDFISIFFTCKIRTELLFTFMFCLTVYATVMAQKRGWKTKYFVLMGLLLGLSTLVRPITTYFPIVIITSLFFDRGFRSKGNADKAKCILVYALVFLVTISPWQYRNMRAYDYYSLSTTQGYNMCRVYATHLKLYLEGRRRRDVYTERDELCDKQVNKLNPSNPFEKYSLMNEVGVQYILQHPRQYLILHLEGVYNLFTNQRNSVGRMRVYRELFQERGLDFGKVSTGLGDFFTKKLFIENMLIIIGYVTVVLRRRISAFHVAFITLTIAYYANVVGVLGIHGISGFPRFRLPMTPLLNMLGACGITAAWPIVLKTRTVMVRIIRGVKHDG
jgi:hypothetical protein